MKKLYVISAVVVLAIACAPKNRSATNQPDTTNDQVKFIPQGALAPQDVGDLDMSSGTGCGSGGVNQNIVDKRLVSGTVIKREKKELNKSVEISYLSDVTVTGNTGDTLTYTNAMTFNKKQVVKNFVCKIAAAVSPALACAIDGDPDRVHYAGEDKNPRVAGACRIEQTKEQVADSAQNNPALVEQGSFPLKSGAVRAKQQTIINSGTLMCGDKEMGQGKEVKKVVYSFDVPSLEKNSCAAAVVLSSWELKDSNNKTIQSKFSKTISYK